MEAKGIEPLPHLVVKCKYVVVKRQSDCAGQHMLVRGLVPNVGHSIAVGRTFAIVLITENRSRLEFVKKIKGTGDTHSFRAPCANM